MRKKLIVVMLFVLVCFPSICFATSYASAKNGVWSDPTAWTPNGNPGNGDSTTITHSINIDSNVTIGVSPASGGTAAIALSGGGQLTLSAGIVLTSRGDITATGTGSIPYMLITMNAGSVIEFDSSAASSPASTLYVMKLGTSHNTFQKLVCNGTSNSHCTIRSNAGGGNGRIAGGDAFLQGGNVDATYTDFLRIGDSSNKSIAFWNSNGNTIFRLQNCTFNSCGKLGSTGTINKASTFYLYKVLMSSTVGSTSMTISGDSSAITGQSEIAYCYFDKIVELFPLARTICHYNYFGGSLSTTSAQWYTFEYNLVDCANNQINTQGDVTGCYLITSVAGNNHGFYMERTDINQTYNGIIVEDITNSVTGDFLFPGPSSSGKTYTIKNCIELTNSLNKTPGKLISCLGFNSSYAASIVIEHNTVATTDATTNEENGLVNWGETGTGKTGMITSLKNNIAYTPSGGTLGTFLFRYTGAVQDAVLAANCDYNARYNLSSVGIGSGNNGAGYLSWDSTAPFTSTPGTHDITSDPNFYAPTRKLGSWGAAIWGTDGTATAALAIIKADPTQIYNSSNANALWQWVQKGYSPQNIAYKDAGSDGVTIGAVEYTAIASSTDFNSRQRDQLRRKWGIHSGGGTATINHDWTSSERTQILKVFAVHDTSSAPTNRDFTDAQRKAILKKIAAPDGLTLTTVIGRDWTDKQRDHLLRLYGVSL